jgi:hypothetical protein
MQSQREDLSMSATEYEAYVAKVAAAAAATGFDYAESRLTAEEMASARMRWPVVVKNYERGILTGGEFDCLIRHNCSPLDLALAKQGQDAA